MQHFSISPQVMYYLLVKHPGRTIVFVNAVSTVRRLAALLKLMGLPVSALHAQQQQRQRLKAVDRFKDHPQGILVATDVAARGLDIKVCLPACLPACLSVCLSVCQPVSPTLSSHHLLLITRACGAWCTTSCPRPRTRTSTAAGARRARARTA
jgi:hypothetical protein